MSKEIEKARLTAWNTAFGVTKRLNALLDNCVLSATDHDVNGWYSTLRQVDKELDCKMNDGQREKVNGALKGVHVKVQRQIKDNHRYGRIEISYDLYEELSNIEKMLRRIADNSGLLVPEKLSIFDTFGEEDE